MALSLKVQSLLEELPGLKISFFEQVECGKIKSDEELILEVNQFYDELYCELEKLWIAVDEGSVLSIKKSLRKYEEFRYLITHNLKDENLFKALYSFN